MQVVEGLPSHNGYATLEGHSHQLASPVCFSPVHDRRRKAGWLATATAHYEVALWCPAGTANYRTDSEKRLRSLIIRTGRFPVNTGGDKTPYNLTIQGGSPTILEGGTTMTIKLSLFTC